MAGERRRLLNVAFVATAALMGTVGGAVAACAIAFMSQRTVQIDAKQREPSGDPVTSRSEVPSLGAWDRIRLASVENQLGRLAPSAAPPSPPSRVPMTPEEVDAARQAQWDNALKAHQAEPVDVRWARAAEASIGQALDQLGQTTHFRLVDTDCRSESCTAGVQFDSYNDARKGFGRILTHVYEPNCGKSILIPRPADESEPYKATVLLSDCRSDGQ